jgi:fibronectin type 3 domain-containing protein
VQLLFRPSTFALLERKAFKMTTAWKGMSWLALVLVQVCVVAAPSTSRAQCDGSLLPPPQPCGTVYCNLADRHWDYKVSAYGTSCGQDGFGFCNGSIYWNCTEPVRGTVIPLYMITDVIYMPPGLNSSVSYATSKSVGTATSVTKSFSNKNGVTVSVAYDGGMSKVSADVSFDHTWTSGSTDSVSVVRLTSDSDTWPCRSPECTDYLDHRNDRIDILARPAVHIAAFGPNITLPPDKPQVRWGIDASLSTVKHLQVGKLNGTVPWYAGEEEDLQNNFGIYPREYPKILSATGYGYTQQLGTVPGYNGFVNLWSGDWQPNPDRYQFYTSKDFKPGPNTTGGTISNTDTNQWDHFYSSSYTVSVKVTAGASVLDDLLDVKATGEASWTWTNSTTTTATYAANYTQAFQLNMPQYGYAGPMNVVLYIDKLYNTFMFSYCSTLLGFMSGCASGPPLPDVAIDPNGSASPTHTPVSLSWLPVMGANGYNVWRSTSPTSGFVSVAPSAGFTFDDATATTTNAPYYYKVVAFNETGLGAESTVAVVPPAPTGLVASVTSTTVNLSWTPTPTATSYTVWRRADAYNTAFQPLANGSGITLTQFVDAVPPAGTQYLYVVTASSGTGSSSYSNQAQSAPATPTGLAASAGDRSVRLTWNAVSGATSYNLVHSTDNVNWTTFSGGTGVTQTYATDSGLTNGVKYYYKVQAASTGGKSPYSSAVSATPVAPPPPPPPDPVCSCPANYTCKCGDGRCYSGSQQCP